MLKFDKKIKPGKALHHFYAASAVELPEGSLGKENEIIGSVKTADPEAVLKNYLLQPEKPRYINATGGEVLCVPYSAPNPEGAMKFLAWLWGSQENYLFCLYGERG
ncbi:MAG: hypothetical protein IJI45_05030, partial [Anaerolineaceae bacterium]|nr:hypothetical protein [Anaerolineaceae bacterium]